jgi:hypothetical protein
MTINTGGLAVVNTAADRPHRPPVALTTASLIRQGLDATLVALVRDVRMALAALDVRVRRGLVFDVFMTGEAILQRLGIGKRRNK